MVGIDTVVGKTAVQQTSIFLPHVRGQFSATQIFRTGGNERIPEISAALSTQKIGDYIPDSATDESSSRHK